MLPAIVVIAALLDPRTPAILALEDRWVGAINRHDASVVGTLLAPQFIHVTYQGRVLDRNATLAALGRSLPYRQQLSHEAVAFYGDAAIVRGVNTIRLGDRVVLRLRFVDVFISSFGRWQAVSAQETSIQEARRASTPSSRRT